MTDPIAYQSTSPRLGLPFLFAAQAQKEFFVNEALVRLDQLVHPAIEGELGVPPESPAEGSSWLVADGATGAWADQDGHIAGFVDGGWVFLTPIPGMQVWDLAQAQTVLRHDGIWHRTARPAPPTGGATIDQEARAAIVNLIASLRAAGIFSGD